MNKEEYAQERQVIRILEPKSLSHEIFRKTEQEKKELKIAKQICKDRHNTLTAKAERQMFLELIVNANTPNFGNLKISSKEFDIEY